MGVLYLLVSDAPVYVLYLLVRLYPALVVLRVGFTFVYFNTVTGGVKSTIIFNLFVHCVTVHCLGCFLSDCEVIPDLC